MAKQKEVTPFFEIKVISEGLIITTIIKNVSFEDAKEKAREVKKIMTDPYFLSIKDQNGTMLLKRVKR